MRPAPIYTVVVSGMFGLAMGIPIGKAVEIEWPSYPTAVVESVPGHVHDQACLKGKP